MICLEEMLIKVQAQYAQTKTTRIEGNIRHSPLEKPRNLNSIRKAATTHGSLGYEVSQRSGMHWEEKESEEKKDHGAEHGFHIESCEAERVLDARARLYLECCGTRVTATCCLAHPKQSLQKLWIISFLVSSIYSFYSLLCTPQVDRWTGTVQINRHEQRWPKCLCLWLGDFRTTLQT